VLWVSNAGEVVDTARESKKIQSPLINTDSIFGDNYD
jgi:hypothetical protein